MFTYKKLILLFPFLFCLFGINQIYAQECVWLDTTKLEDKAHRFPAVIQCDDSGYVIVAGIAESTYFGLESNAFIRKYDPFTKELKWERLILPVGTRSATRRHAAITDLKVDADGNIYAVGLFQRNVYLGDGITIMGTNSGSNVFLCKLSPDGHFLWAETVKCYLQSGSSTINYFFGLSFFPAMPANINNSSVYPKIILTRNQEPIIGFCYRDSALFSTGRYLATNRSTSFGLAIARYKQNGLLDTTINVDSNFTGSYGLACQFDIGIDGYDNLLIATRIGIVKISASGTRYHKFSRVFDYVSLAVRANGSMAVIGNECTLMYLNDTLAPLWVRTSGKSGSLRPMGGLVFSNDFLYQAGIVQIDSVEWGGVIIPIDSANHPNTTNLYKSKLILSKLDTLGNFLWVFSNAKSINDDISGLDADISGNCYLTGRFIDTLHLFNKRIVDSLSNNTKNGYSVIYAAKIREYSITRGEVFPGPYCAGDSITIPYIATGSYDSTNWFIAEISDENGEFNGKQREIGRIQNDSSGVIKTPLPLFSVVSSGNYRIRIRSTQPNVFSFYVRDSLRLLIYSKDSADAGPDISICPGTQTPLSVTGGTRWKWSPSYGLNDSSSRTPISTPFVTTTYRVIISDSSGCGITDTDWVTLRVYDSLNLKLNLLGTSYSISDTLKLCKGSQVTLKANVTGGDSSRYRFKWFEGNSPIGNDSLFKFTANHSFQLKAWVTDSCSLAPDSVTSYVLVDSTLKVLLPADSLILCQGNLLTITPVGIGCDPSNYRYNWTGPGLSNYSDSQLSIDTPLSGRYIAVISDSISGMTDSAAIQVKVLPKLEVSVVGDSVLCGNIPMQLDAVAIGGDSLAYTFEWRSDLDSFKSVISTNQNLVILPEFGMNEYSVILKDGCSATADSAGWMVRRHQPLQLLRSKDTMICFGQELWLSAIPHGGDSAGYQLLWEQLHIDTGYVKVSPKATTVYHIKLTDGCHADTIRDSIKVTVRPPLDLSFLQLPDTCNKDLVWFKIAATGGDSVSRALIYKSSGGTYNAFGDSVVLHLPFKGWFYIGLEDGCSEPKHDSILIHAYPFPDVSVNYSPYQSCEPALVEVSVQINTFNGQQANMEWRPGNGLAPVYFNVSHDTTFYFIYQLPGAYEPELLVTDFAGCYQRLNGSTLLVEPLPDILFETDDTVSLMDELLLQGQISGALSYHWSILPDTQVFSNTSVEYIFSDTGLYRIQLKAIGPNQCADSVIRYVYVKDLYKCFLPTAFTPNLDGLNDVFAPAGTGIRSYQMQLYNRWGEQIYSGDNAWDGKDGSGNEASTGSYFYTLTIWDIYGKQHQLAGTVTLLR